MRWLNLFMTDRLHKYSTYILLVRNGIQKRRNLAIKFHCWFPFLICWRRWSSDLEVADLISRAPTFHPTPFRPTGFDPKLFVQSCFCPILFSSMAYVCPNCFHSNSKVSLGWTKIGQIKMDDYRSWTKVDWTNPGMNENSVRRKQVGGKPYGSKWIGRKVGLP